MLHGTADSARGGGGPNSTIERARALEAELQTRGAMIEAVYYPGADHNDFWRVPNVRADGIARMVAFYHDHLGS